MFEDESEEHDEKPFDPQTRAKEKSEEMRTHAELATVFEAVRKFYAQIDARFDPEQMRDIQRAFAKLDRSRGPDSPLIPPNSAAEAEHILLLPDAQEISTSDYHVSRRPGEVLIVRWLSGEEVATYYERIQAHLDAALAGLREDERSALEWKQDEPTKKYLDELDKVEINMEERYLRALIKEHGLFILSTQTADEINIAYLCDHVMGVEAADLVGPVSAPPDGASESDLAWFFKLFCLRGIVEGVERMCYFTFLQKTDDTFGD